MLLVYKLRSGTQTPVPYIMYNILLQKNLRSYFDHKHCLIIPPMGASDYVKCFPFHIHSSKNVHSHSEDVHLLPLPLHHQQTHTSLLKYVFSLTLGMKIRNRITVAGKPASECGQRKWNLSSYQQHKSLTFNSRGGGGGEGRELAAHLISVLS